MSFITWTFDSQLPLDDLVLKTKPQSYAFGRRLYTFQIEQQKYWLKFHQAHIHQVLEHTFLNELDFYRQNSISKKQFIVPHRIIQFEQSTQFHELALSGQGLILVDTENFFSCVPSDVGIIQQQILKALETLENMHQLGWVHGDLKVEHFRCYKNSCKLIDFEQSLKSSHIIQNLTATPHYMAPELFHAERKTVQSDLYAFGIIVYEWLTETRLQAKTYHDWAVLHCQQLQIQLPKQLECFLPLLNGLMQKHVEQRFKLVSDAKDCLNSTILL